NAMNSLAPQKFADGSAALNTLTQIAGASGTAVAITMFTIGQQNYIEKFSNALPAEFLAHGVHSAFIVVTVVSVLGLVGSFFVKNSKPVGN
ncbi:MAG: MFS transporter, partial [Solibacillus isronensis]